MRWSPAGDHFLGAVQGVYLDRALVMPNASAWDFLRDGIVGLGGYDTAELGRYRAHLDGSGLERLEDPSGANWYTASTKFLWTDGAGRILTDHVEGAREVAAGLFWPDRAAVASSRQGDWIFIRKPDYTAIVVRAWDGAEAVLEFGQYVRVGGMDQGRILVDFYNGVTELVTVDGARARVPIPQAAPIAVAPDGRIWMAGYQPGFGHCVAALDEAPAAWQFFNDPNDFDPAIVIRDGRILVATGYNAGNTIARIYELDPIAQTWRLDGGPWQPRIVCDLSAPPPPDPIPPDPIPPDPIPPDPIPPDPIPPDPIPPDPIPPDPIPIPPDPIVFQSGVLMAAAQPKHSPSASPAATQIHAELSTPAINSAEIRALHILGVNTLENGNVTLTAAVWDKQPDGTYKKRDTGDVWSIQATGEIQTRPKGERGAFEQFQIDEKTGGATCNNVGFNNAGALWSFVLFRADKL